MIAALAGIALCLLMVALIGFSPFVTGDIALGTLAALGALMALVMLVAYWGASEPGPRLR